jgi:YfiH family protein
VTGLRDPLLEPRSARHAFAVSDSQEPRGLARPRQVHGVAVVRAEQCGAGGAAPEADAVVSTTPGLGVAVVTADCVPLLLATRDGSCVAAVHAGWRGLAQGAVEVAVAALAEAAGVLAEEVAAAIGPHAGPCCYEVDGPVLDALAERHGAALGRATRPARPGHALLDLGELARSALLRSGVPDAQVGRAAVACTCCDPRRFASYRREGPRAGRLVHFIVPV